MAWGDNNFQWGTVVLFLLMVLVGGVDCKLAQASESRSTIPTAPVDGWDVDGMHGEFQVEGSLTESPCHLVMESEEQSIDMGVIPKYKLVRTGDHSQAVAVHLKFKDCGMVSNHLRDDNHEETNYQLPDQLVSMITVNGVESSQNRHLLELHGDTTGVALRLEDPEHRQLEPGEHSRGLIMQQGNTDLVLYAMLERTPEPLKDGRFDVLMNFTLGYH